MTTPDGGDNPFEVLRRHGVPFVIIGGYAVNFHGYGRATEDFDVVWMRSPAADESLLLALSELEAHYIDDDIDPATGIERTRPVSAAYLAANHLLMVWTRFGYLDLFDYVPGYPLADVAEMISTAVEHDGLRFASREWILAMKRASGRRKDLDDIRALGLE